MNLYDEEEKTPVRLTFGEEKDVAEHIDSVAAFLGPDYGSPLYVRLQ